MLEIPLTCGLVCPQDYTFKILTIELKKNNFCDKQDQKL